MNYIVSSEKAMATHSSTLAWKIPWTEEPGGLQSMGLLRVRHDLVTSLSLFTFMYWRRKWQPTPVFLPGESQGQGAWWAAIYGVAQSQTWWRDLAAAAVAHWGKPRASEVTWPGLDMWLYWMLALCLPPASLAFLCPTSLISKGQCY